MRQERCKRKKVLLQSHTGSLCLSQPQKLGPILQLFKGWAEMKAEMTQKWKHPSGSKGMGPFLNLCINNRSMERGTVNIRTESYLYLGRHPQQIFEWPSKLPQKWLGQIFGLFSNPASLWSDQSYFSLKGELLQILIWEIEVFRFFSSRGSWELWCGMCQMLFLSLGEEHYGISAWWSWEGT